MPIEVPPWLRPANPAEDWARGAQIGAQVGEAQARLSQQAQETSMRAQVAQQEAQRDNELAQQRIAVSTAYQQEQLQLRRQQLDQVKQVNDQKRQSAARSFAARQTWEKTAAAIDADPNLTQEQKDNAKSNAIIRLAPMMGTAGTEAAATIKALKAPKATVPASVDTESNPDFDIVHQPTGTISLHDKPKPTREPVKVRLDASTVVEMNKDQAQQTIANLPPEMQADPVNKAVMAGATASAQTGKKRYKFDPTAGKLLPQEQ